MSKLGIAGRWWLPPLFVGTIVTLHLVFFVVGYKLGFDRGRCNQICLPDAFLAITSNDDGQTCYCTIGQYQLEELPDE